MSTTSRMFSGAVGFFVAIALIIFTVSISKLNLPAGVPLNPTTEAEALGYFKFEAGFEEGFIAGAMWGIMTYKYNPDDVDINIHITKARMLHWQAYLDYHIIAEKE